VELNQKRGINQKINTNKKLIRLFKKKLRVNKSILLIIVYKIQILKKLKLKAI